MYLDPNYFSPEQLFRMLDTAKEQLERFMVNTSTTLQGNQFQQKQLMEIEDYIAAIQLCLNEKLDPQDASTVKPFLIQ